jgi:molybdopterin converting factor small subunit
MSLTIQYFGPLRALTQCSSETLPVPAGGELRSALATLAERHPAGFRELVLAPDGQVAPCMLLLVNERPLQRQSPPRLAAGDVLTLIAPMSGG